MSYISFTDAGTSDSGKTKLWDVKNNNGYLLGMIKWYSQWRKYTFFPNPTTIYDANCLIEITKFLNTQNTERKA